MENITVDPAVCSGKPCISGTRIIVKNILGMFAGGYTVNQMLNEYPELSKEDIIQAVDYAQRIIDEEKIIITSKK